LLMVCAAQATAHTISKPATRITTSSTPQA
jgi:hypothetical protein